MLVVGSENSKPMRRLAERLGVSAEVTFTAVRDDVSCLLQAADLLLHPARTASTRVGAVPVSGTGGSL